MDFAYKALLDELGARPSSGPLKFRLILQPTIAVVIGARAGVRDAKSRAPPFIWSLLCRRVTGKVQLKTTLYHLAVPILIATMIDATEQMLMFGHIRPLSALAVGTALMSLPYAVARSLSNRIRSGGNTPHSQSAEQ